MAEIQGETRWGTNCSPHPPLNLKDQFTPLSHPQIIGGMGLGEGMKVKTQQGCIGDMPHPPITGTPAGEGVKAPASKPCNALPSV